MATLQFDERGGIPLRQSIHEDGIRYHGGFGL
jgi:hypothetical protein